MWSFTALVVVAFFLSQFQISCGDLETGSGASFRYNIALHAQVAPEPNQIVGSVITTDGLRSAFALRDEVGIVKVFYPYHHEGLAETQWDLVIIEGWFPMIHDFLQIMRSMSSQPIILFFCLDPSYPGINDILTYDVDGFLTNSHTTKKQLEAVMPGRVEYVMLAADPDLMQRNESVARSYQGVYVGAGGRMLEYKPALLEMITAALPFGLRLYGMGWDEMAEPEIQAAAGGVLPRYDIANAYSSAHVVLASTIEAQRRVGMVNNRVFEAMSCEALLLSDHSEALEELSEGSMLFYRNGNDVRSHMEWVTSNPHEARRMGQRAREVILRKHTWAHRTAQIASFVAELSSKKVAQSKCCSRPNCPTLAWVVADGLKEHEDYLSGLALHVYAEICKDYLISEIAEEDFIRGLNVREGEGGGMSDFDAVLLVMNPFDRVDVAVRRAKATRGFGRHVVKQFDKGFGKMQKWMAYMLGVPLSDSAVMQQAAAFAAATSGITDGSDVLSSRMYDLLLFRSRAELQAYRKSFKQFHLPEGHDNFDPCGVGGLRCELLFGLSEHLAREASSKGRLVISSSRGDKNRKTWYEDPQERAPVSPKKDKEEARRLAAMRARRTEVRPVGVVCFWTYVHLCTRIRRQSMVGGSGLQEGDYHLILIGGTLEQWLREQEEQNSPEEILSHEYLHRVVHVATGHAGLQALALIQRLERVYFMHGVGNSEERCDLHSVLSALLSEDKGDLKGCPSRDDTVLWPLVAAASVNASIHMLEANSLYLAAAKLDDLRNWGASYLTSAVQRTVCKAHGLGSAASTLILVPAGTLMFTLAGVDHLSTFVERAMAIGEVGSADAGVAVEGDGEQTSFERLSTPLAVSTSQSDTKQDGLAAIAAVTVAGRLDLRDFMPGRDGDVCFQVLLPHVRRPPPATINDAPPHNMHFPFENEVPMPRGCLMRKDFPVVALNLTLHVRRGPATDSLALSLSDLVSRLAHSTVEVYARGSMFADTVVYRHYDLLPFLQSNAEEIVRAQRIDTRDMNVVDIDLLL